MVHVITENLMGKGPLVESLVIYVYVLDHVPEGDESEEKENLDKW